MDCFPLLTSNQPSTLQNMIGRLVSSKGVTNKPIRIQPDYHIHHVPQFPESQYPGEGKDLGKGSGKKKYIGEQGGWGISQRMDCCSYGYDEGQRKSVLGQQKITMPTSLLIPSFLIKTREVLPKKGLGTIISSFPPSLPWQPSAKLPLGQSQSGPLILLIDTFSTQEQID